MSRLGVLLGACALSATAAHASLSPLVSMTGNVGVTTAGKGTLGSGGTLSVNIPVGSTIERAYLYTSTYGRAFDNVNAGPGGTFNGSPVNYTRLGLTSVANSNLEAGRSDVTAAVAAAYNSAPNSGAYLFNFTENATGFQDGTALVVVYRNPSLPTATVAILDGFASPTGDTTSINFSSPLTPSAAGFFAEMRVGIGFSAGGSQVSTVKVNGTTITDRAGAYDDGVLSNGALFTIGDDNDPFSPMLPTEAQDHERYNLIPYITDGSTSITVDTRNPTNDDLIFLAVFKTAGVAGFNAPPPSSVPEPSSLALAGLALLGTAGLRRRKKN